MAIFDSKLIEDMSGTKGCLEAKEKPTTVGESLALEEDKKIKNSPPYNPTITKSSLDSAAERSCVSREKYAASRQKFLMSYKLSPATTSEGQIESVGMRNKKWLMKKNKPKADNKSNNMQIKAHGSSSSSCSTSFVKDALMCIVLCKAKTGRVRD